MKLESTGYSDAKRIVSDDGHVMAMVVRYTGGMWAVHDRNTDKKLTPPIFKTATKAMRHWEANQ